MIHVILSRDLTMLLITAFFSSILALIFYKLSINVIRLRRKYKVSLGSSKKHKDLEQAIRAHGNLSEFLPIGLILLACLEINHIPKTSHIIVINETANANLPINFFKQQSYNVIFL